MIYSGHSIKEAERKRRGEGEHYILNSPDVKVPNDISGFLSNGENKERLFNLIMQTWMEEKYKLGKKVIYFSSKIKIAISDQLPSYFKGRVQSC